MDECKFITDSLRKVLSEFGSGDEFLDYAEGLLGVMGGKDRRYMYEAVMQNAAGAKMGRYGEAEKVTGELLISDAVESKVFSVFLDGITDKEEMLSLIEPLARSLGTEDFSTEDFILEDGCRVFYFHLIGDPESAEESWIVYSPYKYGYIVCADAKYTCAIEEAYKKHVGGRE